MAQPLSVWGARYPDTCLVFLSGFHCPCVSRSYGQGRCLGFCPLLCSGPRTGAQAHVLERGPLCRGLLGSLGGGLPTLTGRVGAGPAGAPLAALGALRRRCLLLSGLVLTGRPLRRSGLGVFSLRVGVLLFPFQPHRVQEPGLGRGHGHQANRVAADFQYLVSLQEVLGRAGDTLGLCGTPGPSGFASPT